MSEYNPIRYAFIGEDKLSAVTKKVTKSLEETDKTMQKLKKTTQKYSDPLKQLSRDFGRIAKYRFLRSLIKGITSAFKEGIDNLYQYSSLLGGSFANSLDSIATSMHYMKNSLGAVTQPIINALAPAIDYLIDKFVTLLNVINQVLSAFRGMTTWTKAVKTPKKYMDAIAGGAKKAAEEVKKLGLAQIDELTILDNSKAKDSSGGGGALEDFSSMFEELPINDKFQKIVDIIKKHLASIELVLAAFAFAVGAILVFTGANIPLGLGLMAWGAYKIGKEVVMNWNSMTPEIQKCLALVTGVVAGFSLALGALLLFTGANPALGLGLLIIGAASLATSIAINWKADQDKLQTVLNTITGIVLGGSLALGALFFFTGASAPIGLALMVVGAVGLIAATVANWDAGLSPLGNVLRKAQLLVSSFFLVLGTILFFTGNVPIGLALLISGAVSLGVAAIMPMWNFAETKIGGILQGIMTLISTFSAAVGLILVFTGVATPIGIAMLAGGLAGLYGSAKIDWDAVGKEIKRECGIIKDAWDTLKRNATSIWDGIKRTITSALDSLTNRFRNLNWKFPHIKLPHFRLTGEFSLMPPQVPQLSVDWYAKGGFPETGSLFMANEAGPELVGSMNGRTAVANNDQIVAGIQRGVYEAMMSAMSSGTFNANVYLDGKQITDSVVRNVNNEARRTGISPLEVY